MHRVQPCIRISQSGPTTTGNRPVGVHGPDAGCGKAPHPLQEHPRIRRMYASWSRPARTSACITEVHTQDQPTGGGLALAHESPAAAGRVAAAPWTLAWLACMAGLQTCHRQGGPTLQQRSLASRMWGSGTDAVGQDQGQACRRNTRFALACGDAMEQNMRDAGREVAPRLQ